MESYIAEHLVSLPKLATCELFLKDICAAVVRADVSNNTHPEMH
jgi:hypothetical protein